MDKFDQQVKKEVQGFLHKNVHFTSAEREQIRKVTVLRKKRRFTFNPVYWSVLLAAVALFLILSFSFLNDANDLQSANTSEITSTVKEKNQTNQIQEGEDRTAMDSAESATSSEERYNENGDRIYTKEELLNPKSIAYEIEVSEYENLDAYLGDLYQNWNNENSVIRASTDAYTAEQTMASSAVHYINYFEEAIREKGMAEEFDELQRIAFDLTVNPDTSAREETLAQLTKEFESQLNTLYESFR